MSISAHESNAGFQRAVRTAEENLPIQALVSAPEFQVGYTITLLRGRYVVVSADAWEKPASEPMLSWAPPEGTRIAHIAQDKTITFFGEE